MIMRGRFAALAALLITLALAPAGASAAGFGPTTSPLSEPPPTASAPVFASPGSNKLTIFGDTGSVEIPTVESVPAANIAVAGNPAGDALVVWTENQGATHKAVALFWPKGAAPNTLVARELLAGGTVTASAPFAVLDPSRSATVTWSQNNARYQVTTADAGAADPWGAPTTELGGGAGMGASLPDGRAVYAFLRGYTNGAQTWFEALFSTRMPGKPFRPPASLVGGGSPSAPPARIATELSPPAIRAGISAAGRVLVSYIAVDSATPPGVCDPYNRTVHAVLARVEDGSDPPAFTNQAVSDPGDPDPIGLLGTVRGGSDDRLAMAWREVTGGCWDTPNRPERRMAAYVAPGQTSVTPIGPGIPGPPSTFRDLYWKSDGQLIFWTQTSGPIVNSQTPYDTGVPITPFAGLPTAAPPPTPPGSGGAPASGPGPPPAAVARRVSTRFVAAAKGTVKMTVLAPGSGELTVQLLAKKAGLIAAAKPVLVRSYRRRVAKAGTVRLTLALTGRARKTLVRRGRLAITVRTTFKPSGGVAATTSAKTTFRLAPRAR